MLHIFDPFLLKIKTRNMHKIQKLSAALFHYKEKDTRKARAFQPSASMQMLALESRVLLDAAAVETAVDTIQPDLLQEAPDSTASNYGETLRDAVKAIATNPSPAREVLFIDAAVQNQEVLLSGLREGLEVIILDAHQDGLAQMAESLAGRNGIEAIHIVSHGRPGQVTLGSTILSLTNLEANQTSLESIGAALKEGGICCSMVVMWGRERRDRFSWEPWLG